MDQATAQDPHPDRPASNASDGIFGSLVSEVADSKQWIALAGGQHSGECGVGGEGSGAADAAETPGHADSTATRSYFADASNAFLEGGTNAEVAAAAAAADAAAVVASGKATHWQADPEGEEESGYFEHGFQLLDVGGESEARPPSPSAAGAATAAADSAASFWSASALQLQHHHQHQQLQNSASLRGGGGDGGERGGLHREALRTPDAKPEVSAGADAATIAARPLDAPRQLQMRSFGQLECGLCGEIYTEVEAMASHLASVHLSQMPFLQPDQTVLTAADLQQRRVKLLSPTALVCSLRLELRVDGESSPSCYRSHLPCQEGLSEKVAVVTTRDEEGRARPMFECRRCQRLFRTRPEALQHADCARYRCDYCDFVCSSANAKAQHERKRHTATKPAPGVRQQAGTSGGAKRQSHGGAGKKAANSGKIARMVTVSEDPGDHQLQPVLVQSSSAVTEDPSGHMQLLAAQQQVQASAFQQVYTHDQYLQYPGMYATVHQPYYFHGGYPYQMYDPSASETYYTMRPVDEATVAAAAASAAAAAADAQADDGTVAHHVMRDLGQQLM